MRSIRLRSGLEHGQALVLVLLSLAVVLTLVLFILSRSVTDILISSKTEEAARAFSAAEAGIEQALVIGTGGSNSNLGNNAGYVSNVAPASENSTDFNYPIQLFSGDTMTVWFVAHDSAGNITCSDATQPCFSGTVMYVCWGDPAKVANSNTVPSTDPAIEMSIFYDTIANDPASVKIARVTADWNASRRLQDNFETGVGQGCPNGESYAYSKLVTFDNRSIPHAPGNLQFARVRMFYNSDAPQPVAITVTGSGSTLPSQGQNIISTGTAGQSTRKVAVFQGWPEPPSVFDYAIYSSTGIAK